MISVLAGAVFVTAAAIGCANPNGPGGPSAAASSAPASSKTSPAPSSTRMISNNGHNLAFHVTPGHLPAIVFDAGGGQDSSEWAGLVPGVAAATGSMIITYDRAGLGASDEVPGPWKVADAVADLDAGLRQLGLTRDVIFVAHSEAGEIATNFVHDHPGVVAGAVLVDANLPGFFTDDQIARIEAAEQPQIQALEQQPSTRQTRQLLAVAADYGPAHRAYHQLTWPPTVPIDVIVSAKTPFESSESDAHHWRDAQAAFAAAASNRRLLVAQGSSHDVPADRPDIVAQEVEDIVARTR
ncbi:alpha/beta hydrolase [Nocardia terpenica]|uniref:Alpha/beta hydrolase n=2 Tax=Nocardia terpenica TaxID=455432 RepID=A0A291RM38_9NOCA|nr:alpha/beta hydrolase [Nocardia terpenica]